METDWPRQSWCGCLSISMSHLPFTICHVLQESLTANQGPVVTVDQHRCAVLVEPLLFVVFIVGGRGRATEALRWGRWHRGPRGGVLRLPVQRSKAKRRK